MNPKWFIQRFIIPDFETIIKNPYLPFLKDQWVLFTATEEYIRKPTTEKINIAESFFDKRLKEKLIYYHYDEDEFRKWFMGTVTLSLTEAPLKEYSKGKIKLEYREFPKMPKPQYWKYIFEVQVYCYSFVSACVTEILILIFYFAILMIRAMTGDQKKVTLRKQ